MFVFQVYSPATKVFKDKPEGWFEYQLKELGNLKGNIDKLNANPKDSDARNAASKNIGTLITNLTNQYPISTRPGQITASLDSLNSMYEQLNSNKFAAIGFKLAPIEKSLKDTFEKFKGQSYDEFFKPADASQKSGEGSENKKTEAKDDKNDKTTDKKVNKTETPKLSTDEMQKAIADYVKDWPAGVNVKGKDRVEYENVSASGHS